MYRAFFEYSEDKNSYLYKNFITKITNGKDIYTPNISIDETSNRKFAKIVIQLDILEDFTYELKSSFEPYKDVLSNVSSYAGNILGFFDKLNSIAALSNTVSTSGDLLKVQVWKETEPFRMNFKFSLQTKINPFADVYLPAVILSSQTILSPIIDNSGATTNYLRTPGVNYNKISKGANDKEKVQLSTSKTLDTFAILVRNVQPFNQTQQSGLTTRNYSDTEYRRDESVLSDYNSLLAVDYAFIETAKPTWSKERTESGVPLWCELELTVQSVFSANDSMFSFIYPEPDVQDFFSVENAKQIGKKIFNAGTSKVVNIFR